MTARIDRHAESSARGYVWSVAMVAATTVVALGVRAYFGLPDVEMLFLFTVMVAATRYGRGPSLMTAALSVASYDFFFVRPFLTFVVEDVRYTLTFAMMFGIGWVTSTLTTRLRREQAEADEAVLRAKTEELRSSLLSAVSHDLRTPLAAITGAATTLRDDEGLSPATRLELLETVCDEAERLERLLANLLDMTRLQAGRVTLKRDWIPLVEVVGGALGRVEQRLAPERVTMSIPDDLPFVPIDPVLMEQLFVNLFENAAKYTPPGSNVEVRATRTDDRVVVEVADRGTGIPAGDEERVFERFTRGSHVGVPGVGLGLPIARAIARAHDGDLTVAPRPGGGACFRLVIPLAADGPAPDRGAEPS